VIYIVTQDNNRKLKLLFSLCLLLLLLFSFSIKSEIISEDILLDDKVNEQNGDSIPQELIIDSEEELAVIDDSEQEAIEPELTNISNEQETSIEFFYIDLDNINDSIDLNTIDTIQTEILNKTNNSIQKQNNTVNNLTENLNVSDLVNVSINHSIINDSIQDLNLNESFSSIITAESNVTFENEEEIIPEKKIDFYISTDKQQYFINEPVIIILVAPDLMDANVIISNDQEQYAYYYSGQKYPATYKFHLTNIIGTYTVKAVLFDEEPRTKIITFEVIPSLEDKELSVHIDAETRVNQGDPVTFKAIGWSDNDSLNYSWNFDDESYDYGKTVSHAFTEPGIYLVSLNVSDGEKVLSDTIVIHVKPIQYKLVVNVVNPDSKPIPSAYVYLNDSSVETDINGKGVFYFAPGFYNLTVQKEGFMTYSANKDINHNEVFPVTLYDRILIADSINNIKEKNGLSDINVEDKEGVIVNGKLKLDQAVNVVMTLESDKNVFQSEGISNIKIEKREFKVTLHNIDVNKANWAYSDKITIETTNLRLEQESKSLGYVTAAVVSLENVNEFISDPNYYGTVQFDTVDMKFNKLFYCKDNNIHTCELIEPCFNSKYYGGNCYVFDDSYVIVYVDHFSSILVLLDNKTAEVNIYSPDNETYSGEDVYLNFTINETVHAEYSLDFNDFIYLGEGIEFSDILIGNLSYGILANGLHNLTIFVKDDVNNTDLIEYLFVVNDTQIPIINVSFNESSINNSVFIGYNNSYSIIISSNEYASISYALNELFFSDYVDLGDNKSIMIDLTLQNGSNIFLINVTDFHGNKGLYYYVFNYTEPRLENVTFNISTDKSVYNTSDPVEIRVDCPEDASVTISVVGGSTIYSESYTGPITYIYPDTANIGNYSVIGVMIHNGKMQTKTITFEVVSPEPIYQPMSVSLSADKTNIKTGETVMFTATISGGKPPYTYNFDFDGDHTIDEIHTISEQSKSVSYAYSENGTYYANVTIMDEEGNSSYASQDINVRKEIKVVFIVKDQENNIDIEDAKITIDGTSKYTNATGAAYFILLQGIYELKIQNVDYYTLTEDVSINHNTTFTYKLNRTPESQEAPQIELLSPIDGQVISKREVTFIYRAYDNSKMNCSLYTSTGNGWWVLEDTKNDVSSGSSNSVTLSDLEKGIHDWKVECVDTLGNINISDIYSFTLDISEKSDTPSSQTTSSESEATLEAASEDEESYETEINDIISEIDAFKKKFYLFSAAENEVAEAINLEKILEKANTQLTRAKRDLINIVFRRLNETGKEELREEILQRIENIKDTTPKDIKVIESHEFIRYPSTAMIENITLEILFINNVSISKSKLDPFIKETADLQKLITVLTKVKVVQIEFISGKEVTYTLIEKNLQVKGDISNATYIEVIPKEFAKNINDTEFYTDYKVISDDPIVSIDINENKNIVYFIKKKIILKDAENIASILVPNKISDKTLSKITGYGVFKNFRPIFLQSSHKRLVIEIIAVIVLVLIYLAYSLNFFKKVDIHKISLPLSKNHKMLKQINSTLDNGFSYTKENRYEEAKGMYKKAVINFKALPDKLKQNVKDKIIQLCYEVDVTYIALLINQATELIDKNDKKKAAQLYMHITNVYKRIIPKYKAQVLQQCTELHKKLSTLK